MNRGDRPNIVLVLADSMRAANLSCYGYHRQTTPNLDAFAETGTRFANAFTVAPFTVASTASILTGVYPSVHRLEHYGQRLADDLATLPEVLQKAGYSTAGFVANPHVNRESGLTRGFAHFHDGRPWYKRPTAVRHLVAWAESGKALNRSIKRQLRQAGDDPFFFLVFYNDSHVPFSGLPRLLLPLIGNKFHTPDFERIAYTNAELARVVDLYDRSLRRVDRYIGDLYRLFEQSRHADNTIFLFSADHGEGLDRRFTRAGHGRLYENGIHIPLIVHSPRDREKRVVEEMVTTLDFAPTLCEWAQTDPPAQFAGSSLDPLINGRPQGPLHDHVVAEYHDSRAIRTPEWKLIRYGAGIGQPIASTAGRKELYDLRATPTEEDDVAGLYPEIRDRLSALLDRFTADQLASTHHPAEFAADETVVERLRALGYVD